MAAASVLAPPLPAAKVLFRARREMSFSLGLLRTDDLSIAAMGSMWKPRVLKVRAVGADTPYGETAASMDDSVRARARNP